MAQAYYDPRRQRQIYVEAVEQRNENGHDLPQQKDDHAGGDTQHGDRIDHRGLHGALQFDVLLDIGREPLQNRVQNTARLARLNHVVIQCIEHLLVLLHRRRERGAALHRGSHGVEHLLKRLVLLLSGENLKTLHERQARVNHHGELPRKDGQLFFFDARAEGGNVELSSLFGELADIDLLSP